MIIMSIRLVLFFCPLCKSHNITLSINNYPGYLKNTFFDIYRCIECNASFINTEKLDLNIYNFIYQSYQKKSYIIVLKNFLLQIHYNNL